MQCPLTARLSRRARRTPLPSDAGGSAAAANLARDQAAAGAGPGEARGPMTLLEGQADEVELEKSNVLLLGPTGD